MTVAHKLTLVCGRDNSTHSHQSNLSIVKQQGKSQYCKVAAYSISFVVQLLLNFF